MVISQVIYIKYVCPSAQYCEVLLVGVCLRYINDPNNMLSMFSRCCQLAITWLSQCCHPTIPMLSSRLCCSLVGTSVVFGCVWLCCPVSHRSLVEAAFVSRRVAADVCRRTAVVAASRQPISVATRWLQRGFTAATTRLQRTPSAVCSAVCGAVTPACGAAAAAACF